MDIKRMSELSVIITNLKKAAEEIIEIWYIHSDGCKYAVSSDDSNELDRGCIHSDPNCDPVCMYNNCPLLKHL